MIEDLALAAFAAGTASEVTGTLRQGREAEQIGEARARVDEQNAQAVDEATDEKARILEDRRRRTVASTKSDIAASGIKLGGSLDLVTEAEIEDVFFQEKKFATASGRVQSGFLRERASFERAIGKKAKKRSVFQAIGKGVSGAASIAFLGFESGRLGRNKFGKTNRAVKSAVSGGGRLNRGSTSLFDLNTGGGSGRVFT